jgi:hypothetical protein
MNAEYAMNYKEVVMVYVSYYLSLRKNTKGFSQDRNQAKN